MRNLQVDGARLWASLMELARIGAPSKARVWRLAAGSKLVSWPEIDAHPPD
jgi:hypothetical protein